MVERVIRTLKVQCVHRQRFDSLQHAARAIGNWIAFHNPRRPHQALDMKTSAEAIALAAWSAQIPLSQSKSVSAVEPGRGPAATRAAVTGTCDRRTDQRLVAVKSHVTKSETRRQYPP